MENLNRNTLVENKLQGKGGKYQLTLCTITLSLSIDLRKWTNFMSFNVRNNVDLVIITFNVLYTILIYLILKFRDWQTVFSRLERKQVMDDAWIGKTVSNQSVFSKEPNDRSNELKSLIIMWKPIFSCALVRGHFSSCEIIDYLKIEAKHLQKLRVA